MASYLASTASLISSEASMSGPLSCANVWFYHQLGGTWLLLFLSWKICQVLCGSILGLQLGIAPLSRAENTSQWQGTHSTCAKLVWAQFSSSKSKN